MIPFDRLIETIKQQMQPTNRVQHLAGMLQELIPYTPAEVTMADLILGWRLLARSANPNETPSIAHRRRVYADLAAVAAPLTPEPGDLETTVKIWQAWTDGFQTSADPSNAAMAKILARELAELQVLV